VSLEGTHDGRPLRPADVTMAEEAEHPPTVSLAGLGGSLVWVTIGNAIAGADEAIVVCTPEVSAVRDADRVVGLLGNRSSIKLIVNRLRPALVKRGKMLSVDDVNAILRLPLLGVIADEPGVIVATNKGEPLALDDTSSTGAAYRAIAGRIAGTDTSTPEIPQEPTMLQKLGSLFGGRR